MTEEILDEFVRRLIAAMDQQKPKKLTETLWTAEQIAEWLSLSRVTVDTRVITRPDFPKALRPVDSRQSQRRWFASDVVEWARANTGVVPTPRPGRKRKAI